VNQTNSVLAIAVDLYEMFISVYPCRSQPCLVLEKKINEGKHLFTALNAVAAKLLRIIYWVLNNNKEYQIQLA
jgi:hypothetical protein